MKRAKTLACATALVATVASGSAGATLFNWYLDPDGGGTAGKTQISEYLDITGTSYIVLTPTALTTFDFLDNGAFKAPTHDNGEPYTDFSGEITTIFSGATGSGSFGGAFSFSGGTISMYSDLLTGGTKPFASLEAGAPIYGADDGTLIATFDVVGGNGTAEPNGLPTSNGVITVIARATFMASGYFFLPDGTTDISSLIPVVGDSAVFGFATTNATHNVNPTNAVKGEIVDQLAGFGAYLVAENTAGNPIPPVCFNTPTPTGALANETPCLPNFVVGNGGQFRLAVPEPGSLALFGAALLGFGLRRRARGA